MKIHLNAEETGELKKTLIEECLGQCPEFAFKRKITREQNEEGRWTRLLKEMEKFSEEFNTTIEEVMNIYEQVCCCKKRLRLALAGTYKAWSKMEDMGLKDIDSAEYKNLVRLRGQEDVDRRIKFLEMNSEEKDNGVQ